MSTRFYDTDLTDAAWAWVARFCRRTRAGRATAQHQPSCRKRHILVDTLGLLVANRVEPADTSDRRAGALLLGGLSALFPTRVLVAGLPVIVSTSYVRRS